MIAFVFCFPRKENWKKGGKEEGQMKEKMEGRKEFAQIVSLSRPVVAHNPHV